MIGRVAARMFAQAGWPQQYVKSAPCTRPGWFRCAFTWSLRKLFFHAIPTVALFEGVTDVLSVPILRGPVIAKLVASWITGVAFGTMIAVVMPGAMWFSTLLGMTTEAPTPLPVVVTFFPATTPAQK